MLILVEMPANALSRRLGLALFRLHIENGVAVAICMAVVGAGFDLAFGLSVTVLAYTGAVCASVVDQPSRFSIKPPIFAGTVLATGLISLLAALSGGNPIGLGLLVAALSFIAALISAYGRRALGVGVAAVLALVLGMSGQKDTLAAAIEHTAIFVAGGAAYAVLALAVGALLDSRNRRVVLGEALRAFANYLRAKAAAFDPAETHKPSLRALIEANGVLAENLQIARDMIYAGRMTERRLQYANALTSLVDCFEQILSSDADIEILRRSQHRHLLHRMRTLTGDFANDIENLIVELAARRHDIAKIDHRAQLRAIAEEMARLAKTPPADADEEIARAAFSSTHTKLVRAVAQLDRLARVIRRSESVMDAQRVLNLAAFMQQETTSPRVLLAQFKISSPTMRYAIRLTLAMTAGYIITLLFPNYVHGGWILLTTALIMRANYSITRQRRNDRILGTLLGCIVSAALIRFLPGQWPLAVVFLSVGVSHAFGTVNYRITALAASVSALLLIHFMYPGTQPLFFERIVDTLIGAALATGFSFLLPSWERRNVPQLVNNLIKSDCAFAEQALTRAPVEQTYRLARRNALDSVSALSSAARRLLDEPGADKRALAVLNELLGANYLFASDLASVRTALLARAAELNAQATDDVLSAARGIVLDTLAEVRRARAERPDHLRRRGLSELPDTAALPFLRRRLLHIERSARNVAALAARATQN
ncbi:MAG TPA: FUSC family membrane protein [Rhizomicrobium sp.]|nr:FUSC family membrane protein [Rhizomicrobium sp.]